MTVCLHILCLLHSARTNPQTGSLWWECKIWVEINIDIVTPAVNVFESVSFFSLNLLFFSVFPYVHEILCCEQCCWKDLIMAKINDNSKAERKYLFIYFSFSQLLLLIFMVRGEKKTHTYNHYWLRMKYRSEKGSSGKKRLPYNLFSGIDDALSIDLRICLGTHALLGYFFFSSLQIFHFENVIWLSYIIGYRKK